MSKLYFQSVGQNIKKARKLKKLRQVDLVELASLNYRHFQDIEGGKVQISFETLLRISKVLEVSVRDILDPFYYYNFKDINIYSIGQEELELARHTSNQYILLLKEFSDHIQNSSHSKKDLIFERMHNDEVNKFVFYSETKIDWLSKRAIEKFKVPESFEIGTFHKKGKDLRKCYQDILTSPLDLFLWRFDVSVPTGDYTLTQMLTRATDKNFISFVDAESSLLENKVLDRYRSNINNFFSMNT